MMNEVKYNILLEAIEELLDDEYLLADGRDGWFHPELGQRMAEAARAVYDSTMEIQYYMYSGGLEPGPKYEE